jgi:iron complex outermembrane receptor protein
LAVAASLFAAQANAQAKPAAAETPTTVSDLVVVAEKREQRLETVPVAISAYSAEERSLLGIQQIQDLTNFTPGLHYNSIANRPYLRGVGRNTDNLAVASAVAVYYNGVYDGANATTILQHSDLFIDTVEVDRGPQNTLHGANSDGGTINYISKRPTKDFFAEVRAGAANYDTWNGEALISGPITDWLRYRVGYAHTDQTGGFFTNLNGPPQGGTGPQGNNGRTDYWEAQLEGNWDKLDGWFMASSGTYSTYGYHTVATVGAIPINFQPNGAFSPSNFFGLCGLSGVAAANPGCTSGSQRVVGTPLTMAVTANQFPGNNPSTADPRTFIQEYTSTNKQHGDIALATDWTYHFPIADLSYLGGYQKFNYVLDFTSAADSGVLSYQTAAPAAVGGLCALDAAGAGYNPAACTTPLTVNAQPNLTHFIEDDTFFSHEIDLTSTGEGPLQWIGGLYYYHEHYDQPVWAGVLPNQPQLGHPYALNLTTFALTPTPANPSNAISTSDTQLTYTSTAVFGQVDYKFNDQWKLTGGLRYTKDKKSGSQFWRFLEFDVTGGFQSSSFGANTPALDFTTIATAASLGKTFKGAGAATINSAGFATRSLDDSWSAVTGDLNLNWTPDPNTLVYAKYDRGYKAGGFSTFTLAANPETDKETVDAVEAGVKKTFNSVLTVNAAAFYYNYKNDQIPLAVQNAQGLIATQLFNLKSVHISGFEIEGVWRPIDPLTINAQYSYLSAKVNDAGACIEDTIDPLAQLPGANTSGCTQASTTAIVQNLKGQQLPEAPANKFSVSALYTLQFDPGKLTLAGSLIWKDATYGSLFNRYYSKAPAYTQVNFRGTYTDKDDRYTVTTFVNNLFDKNGYDNQTGSLLAAGAIVENQSLIAPRTYGVELRYRFR